MTYVCSLYAEDSLPLSKSRRARDACVVCAEVLRLYVMSTRMARMRRVHVLVMSSWSCCDDLMAAIMDGVQAFTGLEALSSSVLLLSVPVLLCSCCVPSAFFFEYSFLSTATCAPPASLLRPFCVPPASLCVPLCLSAPLYPSISMHPPCVSLQPRHNVSPVSPLCPLFLFSFLQTNNIFNALQLHPASTPATILKLL